METKHTKGEWKVSSNKTYVYNNISDDPCRNFIISCCANIGIKQQEAEANAKLIAAAPELLEALIEAKDRLYGGLKREDLTVRGKELFDRINNAIKKATT